MSLLNLYKIGAIVTPIGTIGGLTTRSLSPGIGTILLKGDGSLSPRFLATGEQKTVCSFSTNAIGLLLTSMSSPWYNFTAPTTLHLTKLSEAGGIASAGNHLKLTIASGAIVMRRIEAVHGQAASISCDIIARGASGGATNPLAYVTSGTLPANVAAEAFTLGPCKVNGSALGSIQRFSLDFGYRDIQIGSDGEVFPTFVGYDGQQPGMTFSSKDAAILAAATIGVAGIAQGATATSIYLSRLVDEGGLRVADATATHMKIGVAAKGFWYPTGVQESDGETTSIELAGTPLDDGSTAIVSFGQSAIS